MLILFPKISWKLNHQKEREAEFKNKKNTKKDKKCTCWKALYAKDEIKQDQHLCGFCEEIECSIGLKLTSGK